jgi:AraC-like DNA-binding protein
MRRASKHTDNGNPLRLVNFSDFPVDDRFPQIKGKLFLADNFDTEDVTEDKQFQSGESRGVGIPVQLSMTLIFFCVKGSLKLKINLQEYELTSCMAATLVVGSFMEIIEFSNDFKGAVLAVATDFLNISEDIKMGMAVYRHAADVPLYKFNDKHMKETEEIYHMMKRKLLDKDFMYREQVAKAYLDLFRYNGFQSFYERSLTLNNRQNARTRKDELFVKFIDLVQKHYRENRLVIFYAEKLCITPKYLSSVIYDYSGKYATQWIDEYVIMDAKALLRSSNNTIKEICIILNFANQSLFAKYFKHHTGMTPREFRKS